MFVQLPEPLPHACLQNHYSKEQRQSRPGYQISLNWPFPVPLCILHSGSPALMKSTLAEPLKTFITEFCQNQFVSVFVEKY
jgi:hypothetical protein